MRTVLASVSSAVALLALAACAATTEEGGTEAPESAVASQAIINGSADTTTPAAVFVYSDAGGCTGSLFKVDRERDLAWVLTAAHCVQNQQGTKIVPQAVLITTDYETDANAIIIQPVRAEYDSRYDGDERYDVAVITLQGIPSDAALPPLLPLASSPDGLSVGKQVTSFGFGTTNVAGTQANSVRNKVSMTVSQLDAIDIVYNQSSKGICRGDSGGPVVSDGKVVGIHSRVTGQSEQTICSGEAYSVRVGAVRAFIDGVVSNDQSSPPAALDACDRCVRNSDYGDTVCRQKRDRCIDDADCNKLLACLQQAGSSSSKQSACLTANPKSQGMLFDYYACSCNDLCTSECSTNADCGGWADQKCGSIDVGEATECVESTCCKEMDEAAADPKANACLTSSSATGCESNARFVAANECLQACDSGASSSGGKSSSGNPDNPDNEDEASSSGSSKKKSNKDTGGCAVSAPGSLDGSSGVLAGLVLGLGLVSAGRRRSARR